MFGCCYSDSIVVDKGLPEPSKEPAPNPFSVTASPSIASTPKKVFFSVISSNVPQPFTSTARQAPEPPFLETLLYDTFACIQTLQMTLKGQNPPRGPLKHLFDNLTKLKQAESPHLSVDSHERALLLKIDPIIFARDYSRAPIVKKKLMLSSLKSFLELLSPPRPSSTALLDANPTLPDFAHVNTLLPPDDDPSSEDT